MSIRSRQIGRATTKRIVAQRARRSLKKMLIELHKHVDSMPPQGDDYAGRCKFCGDLGVRITSLGKVDVCPDIQLKRPHVEPNDAAKIIERCCRSLMFRKVPVNPLSFDIARALSRQTTDDPAPRQTMLDKYFGWASSQRLRKFHLVIEDLRDVWLLPVASRKGTPHGYWIATTEADFKEWVDRSKSAPIKQLTTIHKVARANYPILAEQLELEFWKDLPPAERLAA